jgi:hypothetical protein
VGEKEKLLCSTVKHEHGVLEMPTSINRSSGFMRGIVREGGIYKCFAGMKEMIMDNEGEGRRILSYSAYPYA